VLVLHHESGDTGSADRRTCYQNPNAAGAPPRAPSATVTPALKRLRGKLIAGSEEAPWSTQRRGSMEPAGAVASQPPLCRATALSKAPWQVWIDTGGTFTDCVAVDPDGRARSCKVLSSGALRDVIEHIDDAGRIHLRGRSSLPAVS